MSPTALVTGASSGIGSVFARALARDGHDLVLVARRADRLEALAAEIREATGRHVTVSPADLARPEAPRALFDALAAQGLAVDLLVNNAGFGIHGPTAEAEPARLQEMLDLNVTALTMLSRLFVAPMIERGRGAIVNVASTAAFQPVPFLGAYAATKAYVLSFSEALAVEVAPHGVRVQALCPGSTATEFAEVARFQNDLHERFPLMSAEAVVLASLAGLRADRTVVVPGPVNLAIANAPRLLPRGWVARVSGALFRPAR